MKRINNKKGQAGAVWILIISIAILLVILMIWSILFYSLVKTKEAETNYPGGNVPAEGNADDETTVVSAGIVLPEVNNSCPPVWQCSPWSNEAGQCGIRDCTDMSNCPLKQEPFKVETKVC
jgi:hypothetical protein